MPAARHRVQLPSRVSMLTLPPGGGLAGSRGTERQLQYWQQQLQGLSPLRLATDFPPTGDRQWQQTRQTAARRAFQNAQPDPGDAVYDLAAA